jgi:hypothetical protein
MCKVEIGQGKGCEDPPTSCVFHESVKGPFANELKVSTRRFTHRWSVEWLIRMATQVRHVYT